MREADVFRPATTSAWQECSVLRYRIQRLEISVFWHFRATRTGARSTSPRHPGFRSAQSGLRAYTPSTTGRLNPIAIHASSNFSMNLPE